MEHINNKNFDQIGISGAANPHKKYSAKELAEMMNNCPAELFNVNIAVCTDWYTNDDFMEEMMSSVVDEERIDQLIEFILMMQEYQTVTEHNPKVCCRVPNENKYAPFVDDLKEKLCAMRVRVLHSREISAHMEEIKKRWASMNNTSSSTVHPATPSPSEKSETQVPQFSDASADVPVEYHLADLPEDVQNHILLSDDKIYTEFVNTMKGPVKNWIDNHHLQDCNVVRFVCRLRGIVTTKCSMSIFGKFLEHIGLGNQESNMKQRKDANDNLALEKYDNPPTNGFTDKLWKLRRDGKEVEDLLQDIIKKNAA